MEWCQACQCRTVHDKVRSGVYKCRYCNELGRAVPIFVLERKDIAEMWKSGDCAINSANSENLNRQTFLTTNASQNSEA
jgi:hypothetical protein